MAETLHGAHSQEAQSEQKHRTAIDPTFLPSAINLVLW